MTVPEEIENALQAAQTLLGVSITIIDKQGSLRTREGAPLLGQKRQSHRKHPVCDAGFCQRCIEHCRYQVGGRGDENPAPFLTHCWKGVQEVAVPLWWNRVHVGTLFAGIWRHPQAAALPSTMAQRKTCQTAREALPVLESSRAEALLTALPLVAQGLLATLENCVFLHERPHSRRRQIVRFLHTRAAHPVTLSDLAQELYLTSSRTSHLVKELFGQSFQELLLQERLQNGKQLLQSTDLPIGQIASECGFRNAYYFSRVFARLTGMPPRDWRKTSQT